MLLKSFAVLAIASSLVISTSAYASIKDGNAKTTLNSASCKYTYKKTSSGKSLYEIRFQVSREFDFFASDDVLFLTVTHPTMRTISHNYTIPSGTTAIEFIYPAYVLAGTKYTLDNADGNIQKEILC